MTDAIILYKGAVGVRFTVDTELEASEVSAATLKQLNIKQPDGTVATPWTCTDSGTTIIASSPSGAFDQIGDYEMQAYLEWNGTAKHHGTTFIVTVLDEFE